LAKIAKSATDIAICTTRFKKTKKGNPPCAILGEKGAKKDLDEVVFCPERIVLQFQHVDTGFCWKFHTPFWRLLLHENQSLAKGGRAIGGMVNFSFAQRE
jgi:hypothetical protein